MERGVVKFFNKYKGYGFIESTKTQKELFVHFSSINSSSEFRKLEKGDVVTFKVNTHPKFKKEQAFGVQITK